MIKLIIKINSIIKTKKFKILFKKMKKIKGKNFLY